MHPEPATTIDHGTITGLFTERLIVSAECKAIHFDRTEMGYAEFDARANAVAYDLIDRGVRRGDVVGVVLDRSAAYAIAVFGVLKAGAACLPLNPDDPIARLTGTLRSASAAALVTTAATGDRLDRGPVVEVSDRANTVAPEVGVDAADTAFVFATSGSTGVPKEVVLTHGTCAAQIPWIRDTFGAGPDDVHLLKMSVNFVTLLRCLVWPLLTGGSTVVVPAGRQADLGYLARLTARHRVSLTTFIPSVLRLFLEQPEAARCDALRHVLCGGEPLPPALARRFHAVLPTTTLHNVYGLSEAPLVAHWRCAPGAETTAPIGRPVAGVVGHRVLDASGRPVAPGEVGELYVSGVGVTTGYLGRPDLDAERFSEHGFATGDLVRADADGVLTYAGRGDQLAKVRGFRIELGEVEAALGLHPDVRQAVAAVRESDGERRLIAYVVGAASGSDLRGHLADRLPEYMIPARFIRLADVPLLPNGKVDRAALPDPADSVLERDVPATPARDELEADILAIWQQVLGIDDIGVHDAFIEDLGGDSLRAVDVSLRLEKLLGTELPYESFVGASTIEKLAAACRRHLATLAS
jgi:amino acid adenylation domain-containing protein